MQALPSPTPPQDSASATEFHGAYRASRRSKISFCTHVWFMGAVYVAAAGVYVVFWFAFKNVRPV